MFQEIWNKRKYKGDTQIQSGYKKEDGQTQKSEAGTHKATGTIFLKLKSYVLVVFYKFGIFIMWMGPWASNL